MHMIEIPFFAGMTYDEIAAVLEVSARTARRHSACAQARLYAMMQERSRRTPGVSPLPD